jgi:hypothetical protein
LLGKQTSESSLLFPDPVRYKRTTAASQAAYQRNQARIRAEGQGGPSRVAREQLLPLFGQEGQETIRRAREFTAEERKRKKKPRTSTGVGGGYGGPTS